MNLLYEIYGLSYPMVLVDAFSATRRGLRSQAVGGYGCDDGNDGTMHGGCRVLPASPRRAVHGIQASLDWLLGAYATGSG